MIKLGVQGRGCIAVHWHGYFLELPRRSQIDVDGSQPSVVDLTAGDDDDDDAEDPLKARPSQVVEINSHLREAKLRINAKGLGGNPDLRPSHVHAYCGHSYSTPTDVASEWINWNKLREVTCCRAEYQWEVTPLLNVELIL